jgi:hypothetical protein
VLEIDARCRSSAWSKHVARVHLRADLFVRSGVS